MPIKPRTLYHNYHSSELYHLAVKHGTTDTKIIMRVFLGIVNTRELPHTFAMLKKLLPSVLRSTCYNENNDPFYREVQHTEVGHLFEHILIEHLCLLKASQGYDNVEYTGLTKWNWVVHPMGTFHITVSASKEDMVIFKDAMERTIDLTNIILRSGQPIISNAQPLQAAIKNDPVLTFTRPN